ncbi:MAG: hypothetical protein K6B67_02925 [Lachnospiraceae bacterium]|nr:hypothetical protein [Lachnospiraceae bacterium]
MGFKNAMGKIIRYFTILIILIFAFIMRCEIFQITLADSLYSYYQCFGLSVDEDNMDDFNADLEHVSQKYNCSLFFVSVDKESRLNQVITIYGNKTDLMPELKDHGIEEREYKSLFNGSTKLLFENFSSCNYDDLNKIGFMLSTGAQDTNAKIYEELKGKYNISYPVYYQGTEADMIIITWGVVAIAVIIICIIDILEQKREITIAGLYGVNVRLRVAKEMIKMFMMLQFAYFIGHYLVFMFLSGDYCNRLAMVIYEIGCVIGVSLYLFLLKIDVKQVLLNGNADYKYISFLRILKIVTFGLTFFSIATNVSTLGANIFGDASKILKEEYSNSSFIYLSNSNFQNVYNGGELDLEDEIDVWEALYSEDVENIKPVISMKVAEDSQDYIIINDYAVKLMCDINCDINCTDEVSVFCYDKNKINQKLVKEIIELYSNRNDSLFKEYYYNKKAEISYVNNEQMSGFGMSTNPVIIYFPDTKMLKSSMFSEHQNVFFDISESEFKQVLEKYYWDNNMEVSITNVGEYIDYKQSFIKRFIKYLSSFCIMILLLDLLIIINVILVEYKKDGVEYALKKILGYNIIQKNARQFLYNILPDLSVSIILIIFGKMTNLYSVVTGLMVAFMVIMIEVVVLIIYICVLEKQSIHKILKGGCL